MSDETNPLGLFDPEKLLAGTVDQIGPLLETLTDEQLAQVHDSEKTGADRITLMAEIHREQTRRAEAAKAAADAAAKAEAEKAAAAAAAKAEADKAAQAEGYADAQAKADAIAAAEAAAAKPKRQSKPKAPPAPPAIEIDRDVLMVDRMADKALTILLGDAARPVEQLGVMTIAGLTPKGERWVTADRLVPRLGGLTKVMTVTHAWLLADGVPIGTCELGAPLMLTPGAQVVFAPGTLAFA